LRKTRTPFRSPWTMLRLCMYANPFATSTNLTAHQSGTCRGGHRVVTHKLGGVHVFVLPNKIDDVPVFHPFGNHREPIFTYRHSKQRQDVRVPEVLPGDPFPTEALQSVCPYTCWGASRIRLTLRMASRSLVMYTRTTLMAT
jgi:hypothetical protein